MIVFISRLFNTQQQRRRKRQFLLVCGLLTILLLCGFTFSDVISKVFHLDEYCRTDVIITDSYFEIDTKAFTEINYERMVKELSGQLLENEYKIEISAFEETWILKMLRNIVEFVT